MSHPRKASLLRTTCFSLFSAYLGFGCSVSQGHQNGHSLKTLGGERDYSRFPEVTYLYINDVGMGDVDCMGVAVRYGLIMTAAHCLIPDIENLNQERVNNGNIYPDVATAKRLLDEHGEMKKKHSFYGIGETFAVNPKFIEATLARNLEDNEKVSEHRDKAIANDIGFFEVDHLDRPDWWHKFARLTEKTVAVGDKVELVGESFTWVGKDKLINTCCYIQKIGANKIAGFEDEGNIIVVKGAGNDQIYEQNPEVGASAFEGESGGPLFDDKGVVVGILSSGFIEGDVNTNYFVNLNGESRKYIEAYLKDFDERNGN